MGDPVNVASRIESLTKFYAINLTASEETQKAAADFAWLEIDSVRMKGRETPTAAVPGLAGDAALAATPEFRKQQKLHEAMVAQFNEHAFAGRAGRRARSCGDGRKPCRLLPAICGALRRSRRASTGQIAPGPGDAGEVMRPLEYGRGGSTEYSAMTHTVREKQKLIGRVRRHPAADRGGRAGARRGARLREGDAPAGGCPRGHQRPHLRSRRRPHPHASRRRDPPIPARSIPGLSII